MNYSVDVYNLRFYLIIDVFIYQLKNATLPQESSSLVKRLREIRLEPENMDEWRKFNLPMPTNDLAEVPGKCKQRLKTLNCSGSSDVRATDHFAPMLSTLDMQPRVFLTRISMSSEKFIVRKTEDKSNVPAEISAIYDLWNEPDIDEYHSAVEKVINKTNLNCGQGWSF